MSHLKTIKQLRVSKNLNQQKVANELKISVPAYSKIESGITDINLSRLRQIATFFGVTPQYLITGDEERCNNKQLIDSLTAELNGKKDQVAELQQKIITLYDSIHGV